MKEIKHLFFTYRNGAVAGTLRRYGVPHKTIFGLDVPRLAEIARGQTPSVELADRLWADRDVRESRLLAAYLYPPQEVDMLAFRLFKRLPYAGELLARLAADESCGRAARALEAHLA